MCTCTHTHTYTHTHTHTHTLTHTHTHTHSHIDTHTHTHNDTQTHRHTHTHYKAAYHYLQAECINAISVWLSWRSGLPMAANLRRRLTCTPYSTVQYVLSRIHCTHIHPVHTYTLYTHDTECISKSTVIQLYSTHSHYNSILHNMHIHVHVHVQLNCPIMLCIISACTSVM